MNHLVATGPIRGTVTLADGRTIDVSPDVVTVDDRATAYEIAYLIGERYAAEGHPVVDNFTHTITDEMRAALPPSYNL